MPGKPRLPRPTSDRLEALRLHIRLLREYHDKVFKELDAAYLGEIAGKLRLLCIRTRTNQPLLLSLMEEHGVDVTFAVTHGKPGEVMRLSEYLAQTAVATGTPTRGMAVLTKAEFVLAWAQQRGASHEDSALDDDFASAITTGFGSVAFLFMRTNLALLRAQLLPLPISS